MRSAGAATCLGAALALAMSAAVASAGESHTNCVFNETRWDRRAALEGKMRAAMPFLEWYFRDGSEKGPASPSPKVLDIICEACVVAVDAFIFELNLGVDPDTIIGELSFLCWLIPDGVMELQEDECCGMLSNYVDELVYMVKKSGMDGERFCGVIINDGKCGAADDYVNSWTIDVPPKPKDLPQAPAPSAEAGTTRVLQITDVHMDLTYDLSSEAKDCGNFLCCTNTSGPANTEDSAPGYWGDYKCDFPVWSLQHMFEHIKNTHIDIGYIMLTGDYPGHDLWIQSREKNLRHTKTVVDLVKDIFPGIPVVASMGNHDSFPANSYPTSNVPDPDLNPSWLYDALADYFSDWLPADALDSFRNDGFYSWSVPFMPGLRIIAVNSNLCLTYNFWLNDEWADPAGMLQWLADELLKAEQNQEKVHIVSHVPPGTRDCLLAWGREFSRLVERFEHTIAAQFYGHTHNDEFVVFYDMEEQKRPLSFGFVAPSVTTWHELNPSYRIYTVDNDSKMVLDAETYWADISKAAEQETPPMYELLYDARTDYDMPSLVPHEWNVLAERLAIDDNLWATFKRHYEKNGHDSESRRDIICGLVTHVRTYDARCLDLCGRFGCDDL